METNLDLFKAICNESSPLAQALAVEAVVTYAENIVKFQPQDGRAPDNWPELIDWNATVEACKQILEHYKKLNPDYKVST
jgi:hypothetical protein